MGKSKKTEDSVLIDASPIQAVEKAVITENLINSNSESFDPEAKVIAPINPVIASEILYKFSGAHGTDCICVEGETFHSKNGVFLIPARLTGKVIALGLMASHA